MNLLEKGNYTLKKFFGDSTDTFFGRTIEDILASNFFDSLDARIRELRDSYVLEIGVPGMTRKDITIHVDGRVMWVSAHRNVKDDSWRTMEFSNHLSRSFALPLDTDTNNIKAKCRNGLLTINIGRNKPKNAHRIIKISGEEPGTIKHNRINFWWTQLLDKSRRLLQRKK